MKFTNVFECVKYCQDRFSGNDYIFRGQRTADWGLTSSYFRIKDPIEQKRKACDTENFCQWIKINPALSAFHEDVNARIAIAQRYGFASDLIDFTRDPAIAAYFATAGKIKRADIGVIFVAKISDFELTCEKQQIPNAFYIPKLPDVSSFWRLENQKSLFM
ncbi:MAG: FRG domain-containing protein, partial [Candidatus Nitrosopolaris sp.]